MGEEGLTLTAAVAVVFVLIFMEGLGVITEVGNFTSILYVERDVGITGSVIVVFEVTLLSALNMSEMVGGIGVAERSIGLAFVPVCRYCGNVCSCKTRFCRCGIKC